MFFVVLDIREEGFPLRGLVIGVGGFLSIVYCSSRSVLKFNSEFYWR